VGGAAQGGRGARRVLRSHRARRDDPARGADAVAAVACGAHARSGATKVERRAGERWIAVGAAGGNGGPVLGMDAALAMLSVRQGLAVVRAALDDGGEAELDARARFEQSMDDAEFNCERVARSVYRGALADALLSADLSRAERSAIRAVIRCELEGDPAELAASFVSDRLASAFG
jgi:hypothetical protein